MKRLFTIDLKDYAEDAVHFRRPSARGIVLFPERKIALVYSTKKKYYKFPGGGIHEDEDRVTALIREVREEVGLHVIPASVREFGSVLRLQNSEMMEHTVFEQENFYYFCDVEKEAGLQDLDDYEAEAGFELRIVNIDEAIAVDENFHSDDFFDEIMISREARVLKMIRETLV